MIETGGSTIYRSYAYDSGMGGKNRSNIIYDENKKRKDT